MRARRGKATLAAFGATVALALVPAHAGAFALLNAFAPMGAGPGQASISLGIDVAPDGLVYVGDYMGFRVDVFTPNGDFVRAFGKSVEPNGGDVCTTASGCRAGVTDGSAGSLTAPTGVDVTPSGTVFVADFKHRINVFSSSGAFLRAFGKSVSPSGANVCTAATGCREGVNDGSAGSLYSPTGIEVGPDGLLYVSDYGNQRISIFTQDGAFVRAFGKEVNPSGGNSCTAATGCRVGQSAEAAGAISYAYDLAITPSGQIAVGSGTNARVDIFANDGSFIRSFGIGVNPSQPTVYGVCTTATGCKKGVESAAAGGISFATGVSLDPQGDLVVADIRSNRLMEYSFDGAFIRGFGEGVIDGSPSFQICTTATGCRAGIGSAKPSSIPLPYGATVDCKGAVYATTLESGAGFLQIKRFGELTTEAPPCPPPPGGGGTDSSGSSSSPASDGGSGSTPKGQKPKSAKPKLTIELNKGSGTASLVAVMPDAGTLKLSGKGVRKAKKSTKHPGLLELVIAPTPKVKAKLEKEGKAKVKVVVGYFPEQGEANAQAKAVTLKMARLFWG